MMQFWIGKSQQYLAAEYAKSNRSGCRRCKQKIAKQQLRIGLLNDNDDFASSYWFHLNCFHFKPRHKSLDIQTIDQMVYGVDDLDPQDYDKVIDYLKEELTNFKQNKTDKKNLKPKKDDDESKNNQQNKQLKTKKTKKITKPMQAAPKQQEVKGKNLNKSKSKKQEPIKFMTLDQAKKYNQLLDQFLKLSSNQLKQILQKNCQSKTGSKSQLAAKCADGKLYGKIPNCPTCSGGKLRFDNQKGTYKCPGYMQDTDFKHCGANFTFEQIKRTEWIN